MRRPVTVRIVGPMQWIGYPALIAVAATIVLAMPITLFGLKAPEPVLPLLLAFVWPLIRPSVIAPVVVFLLGLFLDLFWGGNLGMWALVLLVVHAGVLLSRYFIAGQTTVVHFAVYVAATGLAFMLAYWIVMLSTGSTPGLMPLLGQIIPTLLLFPIAVWMMERFDDGDVRFA